MHHPHIKQEMKRNQKDHKKKPLQKPNANLMKSG